MKQYAPIAVFAFNRPDHINRLFKSLVSNQEAKLSKVVVFLDAPRKELDQSKVKEVLKVANTYKGCFESFRVVQRTTNFGCAKNIVQGVSEVLTHSENVIVLEDDLVLGKGFLGYINNALVKYKNNDKVYHVSGYSEFNDGAKNPEAYFSKGMNCWGWGTWADRWSQLDLDLNGHLAAITDRKRCEFNFENSANFYAQLQDNKSKVIDTWAIFWYATIFRRDGLCLNPNRALSVNMGNDGSGDHVGMVQHHKELFQGTIECFPEIIAENKNYRSMLIKIYLKKSNFFKNTVMMIVRMMPAFVQNKFYIFYRKALKMIV